MGLLVAWVTSWARYWLQRAIDICGYNFVYCDTDSVKYIGNVDFAALNDEIRAISECNNGYATDPAGNTHYLGVYEYETTYKRFCSLGAKKYCYEDSKGKLHLTLAGVAKSGADELGNIEAFKATDPPFVFKHSAGMEAYYNDVPHDPITVDGHLLEIPPNIYLKEGEYTLGITLEYKRLLCLTQEEYLKMINTL